MDQVAKHRLNIFLLQAHLIQVDNPTSEEIEKCGQVIHIKDAPILAAALTQNIEALITFNTKDFMKHNVKDFAPSLQFLTPKDFISMYEKAR